MSDALQVDIADRGDGFATVRVGGEIDMATSAQLGQAIRAAGVNAQRIELDFSEVTFMDSAGVRTLLAGRRDCDSLQLVNVPANVERVLRLVGVHNLFGLRPDEDTA